MKVVFVFAIIGLSVAENDSKVYEFRCDYEYIPEIDGWLKFHEIPANWYDARLRCHLEGTTLASPLNLELQEAMHHIANQNGLLDRDMFTGIHATFSKGDYNSIEGVPLSDISHQWAPGEPDNFNDDESCLYLTPNGALGDINCNIPKPYVCYRKNDENLVLNECGTTDDAYIPNKDTGSCYKFHDVPRIYSRAYMACSAEGGYLAIINSEEEAAFIRKLIAKHPETSISHFYDDKVFMGFHDWREHGEWLTTHGESLQKAGYGKWAPGEPNNLTNEFCGAIFRSALLLDLKCDTVHAFICEKNPANLLSD